MKSLASETTVRTGVLSARKMHVLYCIYLLLPREGIKRCSGKPLSPLTSEQQYAIPKLGSIITHINGIIHVKLN